MNMIEKVSKLIDYSGCPFDSCHRNDGDCIECIAISILKEMGLTDTQIKALETEDTRLAVVYKDSKLEGICPETDGDTYAHCKCGDKEWPYCQGWVDSELEPLVNPCKGCEDEEIGEDGFCIFARIADDVMESCLLYERYQARLDERNTSGPEFYAQGFEAGVQAERESVAGWLEERLRQRLNTTHVTDEDWGRTKEVNNILQALKGESDAT